VAGGLAVADGLLAGVELIVGAGLADGDAGRAVAGAGRAVGSGTGTGRVARPAERGNSVMTGSGGAGLCRAADGSGAGTDAGEVVTWAGQIGWPAGSAAALAAAAPGGPGSSAEPAK